MAVLVGVHFWPLAPVLKDPPLYTLGAVMVAVAVLTALASSPRIRIPRWQWRPLRLLPLVAMANPG